MRGIRQVSGKRGERHGEECMEVFEEDGGEGRVEELEELGRVA